LDKKNIEEKPKILYAVSEKQNPPKMSQSFWLLIRMHDVSKIERIGISGGLVLSS
jgi:hypothetical protein